MRLILGLDIPTAGGVRVNGRQYVNHPAPLREVGALLEARAVHPGRSAKNHLLSLAATHGIGARRVNQVLDLVGLAAEGRTVFLSSHVMSELALTAGHVIVVGQGRLIADVGTAELLAGGSSLEEAYMELTAAAVEYRTTNPQAPGGNPRWPNPSPKAR